MAIEAEVSVMWLQAKEWQQPLEAGEGKKQVLSYSLQKEKSPTKTLILAQ